MAKALGAIRRKRWQRNPHCEACGVETIPPEEIARMTGQPVGRLKTLPPHLRDRMATIDHARSRYDPLPTATVGRYRLLCHKCNHSRGREDESRVPPDELRRRSGSYPAGIAALLMLC